MNEPSQAAMPSDLATSSTAASFRFRIYGYPVPWRRHKTMMIGRFAHHYDPKENVDWKRTIQAQVMPLKPERLLEGALVVVATFFLPRPPSLPKRVPYPLKRPDGGNLFKILEDSLTGIIYRDDSQIITHQVNKRFGDQPGVEIEITEIWR